MSDWKKTAAKRRDARNAKDPSTRSLSNKKNTKKWCRGKEGVEHTPECKPFNEVKQWAFADRYPHWRLLVCTTCGKELATYMPLHVPESKPDWVK